MKTKRNSRFPLLAGLALLLLATACSKENSAKQDLSELDGNKALTAMSLAATATSPFVPKVAAYWLPYAGADDVMPLKDIPKTIPLAILFAGGLHDSTGTQVIDTRLMTSTGKNFNKILDTAHILQSQGFKVTVSLFMPNDYNTTIPYDSVALAARKLVVDTWKLDGIDLDIEGRSSSVLTNDINMTKSLSKYFGPLSGTGKILSAVVYMSDGFNVLKGTKGCFDYVATMNYWAVSSGSNQSTFTSIVNAGVPVNQILFGVSAEASFRSTSTGPNVKASTLWQPTQGKKGGMMIFDLGGDYVKGFPITDTIVKYQ
ncbi:MAG TPA: hypothetical protein VM802_24015 [Chitinophaga sp.]|uniref:EndoS/ChiA family endoglycosidase n=1 Tax=Chitinophaga sp. TaxID=1869181 RepID=UPI002CFE7BA5|nr:hypothetical protein [Chitinophaga sp.]HVI47955.1 hypothetical protein [Chitinophaga sp.]